MGNADQVSFQCDSCLTSLKANKSLLGKRIKCPRCQAITSIRPAAEIETPATRQTVDPRQAILNSIQGEVTPVRRTLVYRIGIMIITLVVIILPLVYIGLIVGIGIGTGWHAIANVTVFKAVHSARIAALVYFGPLLAGVVLLFFLLKPVLARYPKADRVIELQVGEEPLLYSFVTRISHCLGAPEPRTILLDCEINASASLGDGLSKWFGSGLTLTLGLPLIAGLTVDQLGGVIAHELGHFSQGVGMRLSTIVRSTNNWFVRAVYERDQWDEKLIEAVEQGGWFSVFIMLAMLCVWLTRRILWIFMAIAHLLSCFLLRQMEYDADRYEARLVGCDTFEKTFRQMLQLNFVEHISNVSLFEKLKQNKLPKDYPQWLISSQKEIPQEMFKKLEEEALAHRTTLLKTHPALRDRLSAVKREKAAGIFHCATSSTLLFQHFQKHCQRATKMFYRNVFKNHAV
jgi:Zn-dependent protease with chaperone function